MTFIKPLRLILLSLLISITIYIPTQTQSSDFIDDVAERTYAYLSSDWATDNHLPWSWRSELSNSGDYANTTEIALLLMSHLGAYEMKRDWSPTWATIEAEINAILDQLLVWQTGTSSYQNSVFYQWYWINHNPPVVGAGAGDHVVPSIDNAFLASSLITLRAYGIQNQHPTIAQKADAILDNMNFLLWYNPTTHRFTWGASENPSGGAVADYYSNENRLINFVARALGQLSPEEYQASLKALVQNPATYDRGTGYTSDDITVRQVAWDGSYFTYTAPGLFIHETETLYAENTLYPATWAQITYASDEGYAVWGLSDCYDIGMGGYIGQGALPSGQGANPEGIPGLVTPHASAMALVTMYADLAESNLYNMTIQFPESYHAQYGFYDSLMANPASPNYGDVSDRFTAIAQGWLFLSIINAETGVLWDYFYQDAGVIDAHHEMLIANNDIQQVVINEQLLYQAMRPYQPIDIYTIITDIQPNGILTTIEFSDNAVANATIAITPTNRLFNAQVGNITFQQGYSPAHQTTIQTQLITVIMQALNDILGEFVTIQDITLSDKTIEILAERP